MIPAIERSTVGGLTVLRAGSPAGRNAAGLVFRVGRFDESLPTAGITHLVEHLALSGITQASYQFNGQVTGRFTAFVMEGASPANTADFLTVVCRGLAGGYGDVLDREKRVLRTEAMSRGDAGALGMCLRERFGATGPGLAAYEEYGLHRLGWAEIAAWRRRWFVAGNAVLWISGDIPSNMRIDIPPDPAPASAELCPVSVTLPGYIVAGRGGIGMSLVGHWSDATTIASDILGQRLTQKLRHDLGVSYGVQGTRDELDDNMSHIWIAADALPDQTSTVAHVMLTALESLADNGSAETETEDYVNRLRRAYESADGPVMALHRQAQNILSARPPRNPGETLQAVSAVSSTSIREAAQEFLDQMIVATPVTIPAVQGRMPRLPRWSRSVITGTDFRSLDSASTLTVASEGVTLTTGPGQHITVRSDAAAALLRWNDKQRALVGADGFALRLDPADWPDGDAVVGGIEARIQPDLIVDIDSPGPAKLQRDEPIATAQQLSGPDAAATRATSLRKWTSRITLGVFLAIGIIGVLAMIGGDIGGGIVFVAIGNVGIAAQRLMRRRRTR